MKELSLMTDKAIIISLAKAYESIRISKELSEQEICIRGGVTKDAIQRFKKGENIGLKNFIKILRGIDQLERLSLLLPKEKQNPLLAKPEPKRKRIRKKKPVVSEMFVWGDDK